MRTHEFYYAQSRRKMPKFNILLTTYEIVMQDLEWLASRFELMDCERRIFLTDTSIQNSMDELFNLLHFVSFRYFNHSYGGNNLENASQLQALQFRAASSSTSCGDSRRT